MNNYLQLLTSVAVVPTGVLIIFFYFFFGRVDDSNQGIRVSQNIGEVRRTDFSQITRILNYIYIGLVVTFLLIVYFLVPQQKLR